MIRTLTLSAALAGGLALATAGGAHAAPLQAQALGGVRIGVGVGVGFPIGGPRYVSRPTGYWTTQMVPTQVAVQVPVQVPVQVAVQVPDHVIGADALGRPIWSYRTELRTEFRTELRTEWRTQLVPQQVWVNTGHVSYPTSSPWGRVGVGVGFRIR